MKKACPLLLGVRVSTHSSVEIDDADVISALQVSSKMYIIDECYKVNILMEFLIYVIFFYSVYGLHIFLFW